jgi:hypothetical protein
MRFERKKEHQRNEQLEDLLREVNVLLGSVESQVIAPFEKNKYPIVLIMGSPRSGTTLFLQWLAGLGYFCYPTNILSRFYGAPYIGAKIQLILTQYDFNKEIFDFNEVIPFTSRLGKTKGALAPNEFWYFWRRFFHFGEIQYLNEDRLKQVDIKRFISELAAIEAVFDKPLALKGMIVNWNIPFIAENLEKVVFVYIKRHPFYNIKSLLRARLDYFGDIRAWYSFRPPEFFELRDKDPYEQVAGQIYYTNRAIEAELASINSARVLKVSYEDFCKSPERFFKEIIEKFRTQGNSFDWAYNWPKAFTDTNIIDTTSDETEKIIQAYKKISGEVLTP